MSEPAYRLFVPASLRRACLATLISLVAQFSLGMVLNLYVPVPASYQHAGYIQEIKTAPLALTAHALLGVVLIGIACLALIIAIGCRDTLTIALAAGGLAAIAGAFAAGELFLRDGQNAVSLWMAVLTGVALVCYIGAFGRTGTRPRRVTRPAPVPPQTAGPSWRSPALPLPRGIPPISGPQPRLGYTPPVPAGGHPRPVYPQPGTGPWQGVPRERGPQA